MKRAISVLLVVLLTACSKPPVPEADLVLTNGKIFTVYKDQPWVSAVAIKDGRLIAVGNNDEIAHYIGGSTAKLDLEGRMAMPGIVDTHMHPDNVAMDSQRCILPGTFENPGEDDLIAAILECDERFADDEILYGYRFTTSAITPGRMNRWFLDELISDRPVFLRDEAGHTVWINTKALELAGLTSDVVGPKGGEVVKNDKGELTGVFKSAARGLLESLWCGDETLDTEVLREGVNWTLDEMTRLGVTSYMDANFKLQMLPLWEQVFASRKVSPQASLCFWATGDMTMPDARAIREAFDNARLPENTRLCAKIYGDNVLEAGTAGLLQNYADRDHAGQSNQTPEFLKEVVRELDKYDIQIKTHAIGDRTARNVLDAYEEVIEARGGNPLRHHLAHLTTVAPEDYPRFRQLDVPGEFIGLITALIPYVKLSYYRTLGHDRFHERMMPIGALHRAGATLSASSDWGAAILDPMRGIQTTVTRKDPNNPEAPIAGPEHTVDLETAIAMNTINGAYLLGREHQTGSLEVGKMADLIVLDQNLFDVPVEEIRYTKVLLTLIGGRVAWKAGEFAL